MKKKILLLVLLVFARTNLWAQSYTIISRNNIDTIKMVPNALRNGMNAAKSIIPGSSTEAPQYRLIKKVQDGKESLIFVDFVKLADKILVAYETDMVLPGEWNVTTISFEDLYNAVVRNNAISLSGSILGMKVEMYQRPPALFEDMVNIDGVEFALPIKLAAYESELAKKAEKAAAKELAEAEKAIAKELAIAAKTANDETKNAEQEKLLFELADRVENQAFVALLVKTQTLKVLYMSEVKKFFPWDKLQRFVENYTEEQLEEMSAKHNKYFDRYEEY